MIHCGMHACSSASACAYVITSDSSFGSDRCCRYLIHVVSSLFLPSFLHRYANILAYDHSRVVLPVINGDPDTDYVNANYIDGYNKQNAYIASQGPVPNSFISFWRMVWHTKVRRQVAGKRKCTSDSENERQRGRGEREYIYARGAF